MSATAVWTSSSSGELVFCAAVLADSIFLEMIPGASLASSPHLTRTTHQRETRMAFFKEAPAKALTRDRDSAKATRDRLAGKLGDAEAAIISAKSLAQRAALDGHDGGLDAAEAA